MGRQLSVHVYKITKMVDYKGQKLGENIFYFITISFGVVAWFVGYAHNDFYLAIKGWAAGLVLALLLCIPDWPFFNRNPVKWLDNIGQYEATAFKKTASDSNNSNTASNESDAKADANSNNAKKSKKNKSS